jgi:hypothetical protein
VPAYGSLVASAIRQCNEVPLRRCGHSPRVRTRSFNHGTRPGTIFVSEPRIAELWPCGYVAKCSAPECRWRATTLRYLDNQERPDHQTEACYTHASELSAIGLKSSAESDRPEAIAGESSCSCAGSIARAPASDGIGIHTRCWRIVRGRLSRIRTHLRLRSAVLGLPRLTAPREGSPSTSLA